jgi:glycosyltransferase involved in cell wall biosynthesis
MALVGIDASRAVSPHPTGTEIYSRRLIEALLSADTSHQFRLYFRTPPADGAFLGAERRVLSFPRLWTHVRLSWEMARHPPDVLFVPAHVLPLIHPSRSLVTIHDLGYLHFPQAHPPLQRLYLDLSTRWNARVAAHILTDSAATRADLVAHCGTDPQRITVAYPGYDERLAAARDLTSLAAVRERYTIPAGYFLYVGTLHPRKNLVHLIEAFAAFRKLRPRSEDVLLLAGRRGWLYDEIFARARRLDVAEFVRFPGYVSEEEKAVLLGGAIAFVFPSSYEGFGLPVLEAQACGCPVLCSNTSSLPEVAGEGALLLDPHSVVEWAERMARVSQDEHLRAQLVARGRANLARFSWRRCAESVLESLNSLAASRR